MTPASGFPTIRRFGDDLVLTRTRRPKASRSFIDPFTAPEIRRLVAEFGSPLLIVDCQRVREQYRTLHKALPGVDLH
jgi:ornithine decarboxylase